MAWQRAGGRCRINPDGVLVSARKNGDGLNLRLQFGPTLVDDLHLKAGQKVDVYRGTHSDRGLLKIVKNGSDRKLQAHKKCAGLFLTLSVSQWGLKDSHRQLPCKHGTDAAGNLVITGPPWLRTGPDE